ncbi:MAG: hypothetical protein IPO01_14975 [Chitinophagaceae bacterium]|nr:hypothetical protein [Chitinophagaceae bacterium]MBK9486435.1 hypothetical protein [Chitinophagaceae bacterium]
MKLLLSAITLTVCIALTSCTNGQNPFPDNISVTKTENLKRLKGTKLFVSTPDSYKPMESMVRLQRDNNTYFQAIEIPNSNFNEYKSKLTKQAIESQGAKVDIDKPIKYNGFEAIYFSGPSKTDGETKLGLAFGDETFVMMIVGVCQTSDKAAMDELNKIFSTSYYDKSFDLNPLELANFKFDESITGFKYAATMGNMFIYSPNGKADLNSQQKLPSSFQIMTIEAPSFSKAKEFLDYTISRYSLQGIEVSNVKKQDISINDNDAYEVTMQATESNKKTTLYQVIIHKGGTAVLFLGSDEEGKWFDKFKATAQTIKM